MTGTAAEVAATEPVEPQSLKKLSFKSLKRSLNLFSPVHGHHPPPDPESNRIRVSYKLNAEYGSVKNLSIERAREQGRDNAQGQGQGHQASTSSELALTGNHESRDPQREGGQNALVAVPSMLPRWPDTGNQSRNVAGAVVSFPGSSERHHSTSALMERIPSRWPRPTWHAPWKNYRELKQVDSYFALQLL